MMCLILDAIIFYEKMTAHVHKRHLIIRCLTSHQLQHVRQRQVRQIDVCPLDLHNDTDGQDPRQQVAVRDDDALGGARGAAGVHDDGGVRGQDRWGLWGFLE